MGEAYIVGVKVNEPTLTYAYAEEPVAVHDDVVINDGGNEYLGKVVNVRSVREGENTEIYVPLERKASKTDLISAKTNAEQDERLLPLVQKKASDEGLDMQIFRLITSLDGQKATVLYTADSRVDFRSLLHVLPHLVHARIEMKQVGPRDKAKMVGGLGICGLPLCCSTFLSSFDGISIAMAKDQMLAINIPKLSGQCGKLICCLKYEDEAYVRERPNYPRNGTAVVYEGKTMKVSSVNILSRTVTLSSPDDMKTISLDEFNAIKEGKTYSPSVTATPSSTELPKPSDLGIVHPASESEAVLEAKKAEQERIRSLDRSRSAKKNPNPANRNGNNSGNRPDGRNRNSDSNPFRGEERWMYKGNKKGNGNNRSRPNRPNGKVENNSSPKNGNNNTNARPNGKNAQNRGNPNNGKSRPNPKNGQNRRPSNNPKPDKNNRGNNGHGA